MVTIFDVGILIVSDIRHTHFIHDVRVFGITEFKFNSLRPRIHHRTLRTWLYQSNDEFSNSWLRYFPRELKSRRGVSVCTFMLSIAISPRTPRMYPSNAWSKNTDPHRAPATIINTDWQCGYASLIELTSTTRNLIKL